MKKLISSILLMVFTFSVNAQLKTPKPSPAAKIEQQIGLTDVSINYSRPGVKGRTIFGDLVPYGKLWRTGANENTVITFSDDVVIDGKTLKEGSYAIYTKPNASSWELIFYTDIKNWGTPKEWDDSKVALSTTVSVEKMPVSIETFTFLIDNVTANDAILGMLWENSYVGVKVTVPTDKIVERQWLKIAQALVIIMLLLLII